VTDGRSVSQKPILLQRLRNGSRRSRSAAEQMPVQAGAQYVIFATIVAWNTSCNDVDGMPWLRRTRRAYSRLEQDDSNWSTWSVAVSRLLCNYTSMQKLFQKLQYTTTEIDIANNMPFPSLWIMDLVEANINNYSILLHHVSSDKAWNPGSNNQNISIPCKQQQLVTWCVSMTNGRRCIA